MLRKHIWVKWTLPGVLIQHILLMFVLLSCTAGATTSSKPLPIPVTSSIGATAAALPTVIPQPRPTVTAIRIATSSPRPITIWIDSQLPADVQSSLVKSIGRQLSGVALTQQADSPADIQITAQAAFTSTFAVALITRTYAVAAPFPTVADSITLVALNSFWHGNTDAMKSVTNNGRTPTLFIDPDTHAALTNLLGKVDAKASIDEVAAAELVDKSWASRPASFVVVPFDQLEPRLKLIQLDGMNLFEKQMDVSRYPLTLIVSAHFNNASLLPVIQSLPVSNNRDVNKLAIVAMTGTTAMVRGTAVQMERKGITYPGEAIRDWMTTADIRHVSNEVSFWNYCPPPTFNDGVSMCSNPKYLGLLKYMGVNIVELSGNHLWDKGAEYLSPTIQLYENQGWHTFAGGRTYTESIRPLTMTIAGNKLAFVGCNWFGADWATPTNELAGSALCGAPDSHSLNLITPTISMLVDQGYLVIAAIQYEEYYQYAPMPQQERDFKALRNAGASVINGSQGHWVQGFDVSAKGFIHYGVGNLFFGDQEGVGTHQMFVDRHAFYAGRYLGTDLRSGFIVDYSRPEPMSLVERQKLLRILFAATGY